MLDYRGAAATARQRIRARMREAASQKGGLSEDVAIINEGKSFRKHLAEAARRFNPETEVKPALLLAVPERLLDCWAALAFGPPSDKAGSPGGPSAEWRQWQGFGKSTVLPNLTRREYDAVLLTHGLSAIADSTLLLADIGRAARIAEAMRLPLHCMLADVSWMSYNRSVRQFDLDDRQIEDGLRLCLDRRTRLYRALGIVAKIHGFSSYQRSDAISNEKVAAIAKLYSSLIVLLWGPDATESDKPLTTDMVAKIGRPLQHSLYSESPLAPLGKFPGALQAIEDALSQHLGIIRALAQKFRVLSSDTFSYYFAQYYAQKQYRARFVKVAPESERSFDEPFDSLDVSFRAWGEGSDPTLGVPARRKGRTQIKKPRLAGVYLPQYRVAGWALLPYTPLSLDALTQTERKVTAVTSNTLLLTDTCDASLVKIQEILARTLQLNGAAELNRLIGDLVWFLRLASRCRGVIESQTENGPQLADILASLHPSLWLAFRAEAKGTENASNLWLSWLDAIEAPTPLEYTPSHLLVACLEVTDWTAAALAGAAALVRLANRVALKLSE